MVLRNNVKSCASILSITDFFFKIFYCPTRKEKKLYTYDKNGIPIIQIVEKRTTTIHQTNMGTRDDDKSSKN